MTVCSAAEVAKIDYAYDAKGRLSTITYPNGVTSFWNYYTDTGRLKEAGHRRGTELIYSDVFEYYPNSPLYKTRTHKKLQSGVEIAEITQYEYDAYQRLAKVVEPSGRQTDYAYDPFGNRTREVIADPNNAGGARTAGTYDYIYEMDGAEAYCGRTPAAKPRGNRLYRIKRNNTIIEEFEYDNAGRITRRIDENCGNTDYVFDDRGLLVTVRRPGNLIVDFRYDALGVRKAKIVNNDGVVTTTYFVTANIFGLPQVLMEVDGSIQSTATYVYGGSRQFIEEGITGSSYYKLHDGHVGSVTHVLDQNATIVAVKTYDAFGGGATNNGGQIGNTGFSGEVFDEEIALIYLRARYYEPSLGRFVSADPYWGRLQEPITQNRYIYVKNNPLQNTDPTGLDTTFSQSCVSAGVVGYGGSICLSSHSDPSGNRAIVWSLDGATTSGAGVDIAFLKGYTNASNIFQVIDDRNVTVTVDMNPTAIGGTYGKVYSQDWSGTVGGINLTEGVGASGSVSTEITSGYIAVTYGPSTFPLPNMPSTEFLNNYYSIKNGLPTEYIAGGECTASYGS